MTLPVHHRPGRALERAFPSWRGPIAAEFDELFERINHLLESTVALPAVAEGLAWAPLAEMRETDDAYLVECELPGIKRENIDVEMGERELCITGELKERGREGTMRHSTRRTGRFEYRAMLPTEVRAKDVSATLDDGVLTVTIPKAQAAQPLHIKVKGTSA